MRQSLKIADGLTLPIEAVTQTFGIVAKRGAGKTNTAVDMAEEMLDAKQQVIVVDPVGVWWGLRSSADGKSAGYEIVVLGGDHGDIPLNADLEAKQQMLEGERIARIVIEHRLSIILDVSDLRKHKQYAFLTGFFETLYRVNRNAVHVFMDEADAFAPQMKLDQDNRLIGAVQDIVRRGRAKGIGVTLISQRIAALSKDVLTQIEVLICLRTVGKHDLDAIKSWVEKNADPDKLAMLQQELPSLPIGTGWLWSPGWLQRLVKLEFRKRRTFDSSATPKVGETRLQPKKMAAVSLSTIKTLFEQPKPEPKVQKAAGYAGQREKFVPQPPVEVPVLTDDDRKLLETFVSHAKGAVIQIDGLQETLAHYRKDFQTQIDRVSAVLSKAATVSQRALPAKPSNNGAGPAQRGYPEAGRNLVGAPRPQAKAQLDGDLKAPHQKILNTLVTAHKDLMIDTLDRTLLALWSGYAVGGTFNNYLGEMRTAGLIDYRPASNKKPGVYATALGLSAGQTSEVPLTLQSYQEAWLGRIAAPQRKIIGVLMDIWPEMMEKEELASATGYSIGGTFNNYLGELRTLGMLDYPEPKMVAATDLLFPNALMKETTNA